MILSLLIAGVIALVILGGKRHFTDQFCKQVAELFSQSQNISGKTFQLDQLSGLPDPVKRYFNYVLKEGQPYISYVRLTHAGQFKTGLAKKWVTITGEQYYTTEKPGYIWKGTTALFTARDFYLSDKGRLIVTLLSLFNIVNGSGKSFDQGELLRWLAESVWYPTNFLPSERLQWTPIDSESARLTFLYKDLSLFFIVRFNAVGEIVELETKRFIDENKLETWICKMNNYQSVNNVKVPIECQAIWRLQTGDVSYAKFRVTKIEYHKPFQF